MTTVSIIGTAGRRDDADRMSKSLYYKMVLEAQRIITEVWGLKWEDIILVSGGAAYADHVAVSLTLMHQCKLKLYFPCAWDEYKCQFVDNNSQDWRVNPGKTSNYYHKKFSDKMGANTLFGLQKVMKMPTTTTLYGTGFKERNTPVSKSSHILAFTFGEGENPKDGGTKDTWIKSQRHNPHRIHIPLGQL